MVGRVAVGVWSGVTNPCAVARGAGPLATVLRIDLAVCALLLVVSTGVITVSNSGRLGGQEKGRLSHGEPASPQRRGRSAALVMPMRGPHARAGDAAPGVSEKGAASIGA